MIIFLIIFAANKGFIMRRKKKREIFRVILPCKGYVKEYLSKNFGRPDENWPDLVNLSSDKVLHDYFLALLKRGEERYDNKFCGSLYKYEVSVEITHDHFMRYGWMLTATDTAKLNAMLERRIKSMLYGYVSALRTVGIPTMECIRRFRMRTGITEWMWDTDSIRKDLQRNLHVSPALFMDFLQKIEGNVWRNLSQAGIVTQQGEIIYNESNII